MKNLIIIAFLTLTTVILGQTASELEMINLINQVRTNPKSFIPVVENYIKNIESNSNGFDNIKIKGAVVTKKTNHKPEGMNQYIDAAKELIVFLNTQKPVKSLEFKPELYKMTKCQAIFLDSTKQVTHDGPNGTSFMFRTKNCGYLLGENCGTGQTATDVMLQLLMDVGVKNKGHRTNIFKADYKILSVGNSSKYWVQDFGY